MPTVRMILTALAAGVALVALGLVGILVAGVCLWSEDGSEAASQPEPPAKYDYQSRFVPAERRGPVVVRASTQRGRRVVAYTGVVRSTLWSSAAAAGMDPQLLQGLTEIFAWQMDFNREAFEGDRWRLTAEQRTAGAVAAYGDIIAAEYDHDGQVYSAVRVSDGRGVRYFAADGSSLKRMFLRSPLHYTRVTSGFTTQRFHPILMVNLPHLGVDFGAPTGTPVMAFGDGEILVAGLSAGAGRMISIRHGGRYLTKYMHLSRFAQGIAAGAAVKMGQVIGYVGATGLATGPHLHFELHDGARVLDPQTVRFPAAPSLAPEELAAFRPAAAKVLAELPPWSVVALSGEREAAGGHHRPRVE